MPTITEQRSPFFRVFLTGVGLTAVGLAILGVILPFVPTTPFLILAAACFVRSSPRLHRRLLASRMGPLLLQWQRSRSIPPGAKRRAYALVLVTFSLSIALAGGAAPRIALAVVGLLLCVFLARLRTAEPVPDTARVSVGDRAPTAPA